MRTFALALALVFATTAVAAADQLADDRAAQAAKVYDALRARTAAPSDEELYRWSVRWLDAQLDAQPKAAAKAFADHAQRMAQLEATAKAGYKSGLIDAVALTMATYYRLEADLWAARGKKS